MRVKQKKIYAVAILLFVTIVSTCFTMVDPTAEWDKAFLSVLWCFGLTVAVIQMFSSDVVRNQSEKTVIMLAWIVRILYATMNNLEIFLFRGDDFFSMAHGLYYGYDHVINGTYPVLTHYPPILLGEFRIFGINRFVTCYVNAFLGMLAIYYLLKCFQLLNIERKVRIILLFVFSFNIFFILYGSDVFRESIYMTLVTISLYYFIKWTQNRKPMDVIVALIVLIPVVWLHTGYIMIAGGYIVVCIFYLKKVTFERLVYKYVLVVAMGLFVIMAVFASLWGYALSSYMNHLNEGVSAFWSYFDNVLMGDNSNAGSVYLLWMSGISSIWMMIIYTPIRMFYFLFSPIVWDCYRVQDFVIFITDSVVFLSSFYYVLKVCIFRRKRSLVRSDGHYGVLVGTAVVVLLTTIPFAWGTFNAGTAIRHRNCLLPFIIIQLAICLSARKRRINEEEEDVKSIRGVRTAR